MHYWTIGLWREMPVSQLNVGLMASTSFGGSLDRKSSIFCVDYLEAYTYTDEGKTFEGQTV